MEQMFVLFSIKIFMDTRSMKYSSLFIPTPACSQLWHSSIRFGKSTSRSLMFLLSESWISTWKLNLTRAKSIYYLEKNKKTALFVNNFNVIIKWIVAYWRFKTLNSCRMDLTASHEGDTEYCDPGMISLSFVPSLTWHNFMKDPTTSDGLSVKSFVKMSHNLLNLLQINNSLCRSTHWNSRQFRRSKAWTFIYILNMRHVEWILKINR